jgi:hypothetical protein
MAAEVCELLEQVAQIGLLGPGRVRDGHVADA